MVTEFKDSLSYYLPFYIFYMTYMMTILRLCKFIIPEILVLFPRTIEIGSYSHTRIYSIALFTEMY